MGGGGGGGGGVPYHSVIDTSVTVPATSANCFYPGSYNVVPSESW